MKNRFLLTFPRLPDRTFLMTFSNHFKVDQQGNHPTLDYAERRRSDDWEDVIKRVFDIAFSLTVMLCGVPLFLIVIVMVKCSSHGPVFFLQTRTGRWGKPFRIIKFRTMYTDSAKYNLTHSLGAMDPRITPIGKFLRKTRLDELPQFLNVLMGEMSVVGPRPLHQVDVDMLMAQASHDFQRLLTLRPGITSIGQIKVGYATNAAENLRRLKYDIIYLDIYSLTTDLYLIWLTIQVVLTGKGR